jgi:hypothetical protein
VRGRDRGSPERRTGAAARIVLHGNACPVVESVLEPRITGESAKRSLPKLGSWLLGSNGGRPPWATPA